MKKTVHKLSCGGKSKVKRFSNGTTSTDVSTDKSFSDQLTELVKKNMGLSTGMNMSSNVLTGLLNNEGEKIKNNMDPRNDPESAMKKISGLNAAGSIISGAAKGSAFGLPGIIGGAVLSGLGSIIGIKRKNEEIAEATEDWSNNWSKDTAEGIKRTGYIKGGKIKGPGTGKSDSISMSAPDGSFIVPEENSEQGMELGRSYLGWDKNEKTKHDKGGSEIKVSNGEIIFTPEEVSVLKYHGINLDELAPKAQNKIGMKSGGLSRKEDYGSKKKPYPKVASKNFAGGHRSYPIPSKADAVDALHLAGIHGRSDVKAKVYAKYPDLKKKKINGGIVIELKTGGPTKVKAEEILHDNEVYGHKLTKKQRGFIAHKAGKFVDGGEKEDWRYDKDNNLVISDSLHTAYDKSGSEYVFNTDLDKYVKLKSGSPFGLDVYDRGKNKKKDENGPKWLKNAPEFMGALQAAGGAYGLIQAGKTPDLTVSTTLNKLSGEVRKLAEYGYEPSVLNALNTEIENTRRNLSTVIENTDSNSPMVRMAQLGSLLSTTIDKKVGLAYANAAEKSRKWADVLKVDMTKAGQEFDINKIKIEDWYKNQEVFAGLVNAGISNIVGARQLKTEQELLRQIGGKDPVWSPVK
jgi:hypothetical protein